MAPDANVGLEGEATRIGLWAGIVLVATLFGFVVGYGVSSRTGVEPGYFDALEAGGYGVAPSAAPKMGEDMRKYYEELLK